VSHALQTVSRELAACLAPKTRSGAEAGPQKRYFRPLSKEFHRGGFRYRQIAREGDAAIYSQTWNGCLDPAICFEVIRVKRRKGFEIDGRFVPPGETYPASKLWGTDGFTLTDKDAAFTKLREIVASPDALGRFKQKEAGCTEKSPT
jgi:hypothetical protein